MGLPRALSAGTALLLALGVTVALSAGTPGGCVPSTVDVASVSKLGTVAGFSGDQLANAALIMNAATAAGLPAAAQTLGVAAAIGESTLRNLDRGDEAQGVTNPDGTVTCSVGLFQQQWCLPGAPWGSKADTMDPSTAAGSFFARLAVLPGWETMTPTLAIHQIQSNANPDHYTPYFAPAAQVVQALAGISGAGSCASVGTDAQALAQELVAAADEGRLYGNVPDHIKEIRWIAQGKAVPKCGIDVGTLQVLVLVVREFQRVGVSSINRLCTDENEGTQAHWANGGGNAVDFFNIDGVRTTGSDGNSLRIIALLDPVMPEGSRVGQSNCRAATGTTVALTRWTEIPDSCNHLHIDVLLAKTPLLVS